jgi:uncharacterized protein
MNGVEIIVALVLVLGVIGTIVPLLPGLPLMWGAIFVWAITSDAAVRWPVFAAVTVIAAVGIVAATVLPVRRTAVDRRWRGTSAAMVVGTVVGFFVIPVIGALIGGPVAIFVVELVRRRDVGQARRSAAGAMKAVGIGVAAQLTAAVLVAGLWFVAVLAW